ncbi:uncharacterized protein B0H18DRAFT_1007637 [Fomitopsis serialis]|uniref:uncharacterized protein n=1 Tax=Fomitopsis serialis TaxID=139415 RepID=UPI002008DF9C|nr:uncharacterized protein B0H18DRAFT_1007637 [Neoantrodia serialis]KAH9926034.1 hypothetical protein B0H18DRAFT_1007637 [Neoantrodia serialis]
MHVVCPERPYITSRTIEGSLPGRHAPTVRHVLGNAVPQGTARHDATPSSRGYIQTRLAVGPHAPNRHLWFLEYDRDSPERDDVHKPHRAATPMAPQK